MKVWTASIGILWAWIVFGGTSQAQYPARLGLPIPIDKQETLPVPKSTSGELYQKQLEPLPALTLTPISSTPSIQKDTMPTTVLKLSEVLDSVERHYPLLVAAFSERGIAAGGALSAQGNYDLSVTGHDRVIQGSFDSHRLGLGLAQPLLFQGIDLLAGYRLGAGDYPVYYQDRKTAKAGEFRFGMTVPLLKNRQIDSGRAALQKTSLDRELAEPTIAVQRLLFLRQAAQAYWNWVAAGQRYEIARRLLQIAETREEFLLKRLKAGAEDRVEVIDNRRLIVDRRMRLVQFKRGFEQASIDLSLFLRNDAGKPLRAEEVWKVPVFPEPALPNPASLAQDIQTAWSQRPELLSFNLQRQRLSVDLEWAKNQMLPSLDVVLVGAQDVGSGKKTLDRYTYEGGILLNAPLQRRMAKGKILSTQAKLAQISAKEQYAREQIAAQVQDAVSALVRAYEMRQQAKQTVELTKVLEEAERKKRDLGKSNILLVNLRELARAEAELQEVSALLQYFIAYADYVAALGSTSLPRD